MRPKVTFDNHKAVYDFYKDHRPRPSTRAFLYGVVGKILAPQPKYIGKAQEQISDLEESGRTAVLVSDHTSLLDPLHLAALIRREKPFWWLQGNAFIPAKIGLFKYPVVRHIIDGLDGIPVARTKDVKKEESKNGGKPVATRAMGIEFFDVCTHRLNQGQNMAVFPEAERNTVDATKLQPLESGPGKLVCDVTDIEQPALVPMSIHYNKLFHGKFRAPDIFIGEPSVEPFNHRKEVIAWLAPALQACKDAALERAA